MMKFGSSVFILLCFIASTSQGAKILFFFAGGSYSHKSSAWAWATELSNRGHDITFLSPHEKKPSDQGHLIHDVTSKALNKLMSNTYDIDRFTERQLGKEKEMLRGYGAVSISICDTLLNSGSKDPALQPLIYNATFDLVVINLIFGECGYILANNYKAKTIVYDASVSLPWFYDVYGFLPESSWIPDILYKFHNFPLTFVDRCFNAFWSVYWYMDRCNNIYPQLEKLMKQSFNFEAISPPSLLELEKNASIVFVNSHHAMDFAYTLPPMIKMIGGVQTWLAEKPIPQKYLEFMDQAGPKGVVLISFGSTINLEKVPVFYQNIFFNLVKKYEDVRFLVKWNGSLPDGFENGLNNLMVSDWLPQRELLRHPNIQAFVTHGGLNSMQEATHYGVPLIVLPLFADQDYNAFRVYAQEVGLRLEIRDLNFDIMDKALHSILNNPKYKNNMKTKSQIFRDRPQSPMELIIYWTEFVLRHDDMSSFRPDHQLTWYELRSLDVYFLGSTIVAFLIFIIGLILIKITKYLFVQKLSTSKPTRSTKTKTKFKSS